MRLSLSLLLIALWILPDGAWAQSETVHIPSQERVEPRERRRDVIQGNDIRATITNWNQTGQSGTPGDFAYEYPKNTGRIYISLSQLWVGAEVPMRNPTTGEVRRQPILNVSDFRNNPDGASQNRWTFQPIRGYVNPQGSEFGIARNDSRTSWPPFWPDKMTDENDPGWRNSWPGYFGKNINNADQEFYFKTGDDQYDRYINPATAPNGFFYYPDSTDETRGGLGLVIETRVMAWSQVLINNVVFNIFSIRNDGTEDMDRVAFGVWLADIVGGDGADDVPFFDLGQSTVFMTDNDARGTAPFGNSVVGVAGITFIETPGNNRDRIDNDYPAFINQSCDVIECTSPIVTAELLVGEIPGNGIDDNFNGLVDESEADLAFNLAGVTSPGKAFADGIDNDGDGEDNSPVVTQEMIDAAAADRWLRWPSFPETDAFLNPIRNMPSFRRVAVHLLQLNNTHLGMKFKDGIDNNDSAAQPQTTFPYLGEPGSPRVTQAMIDQASTDRWRRFIVLAPGGQDVCTILYGVGPEDLNLPYKDCVDNDGDGATDEGIDENIDEMIDESRNDGIDNNRNWNIVQDDTGLDGVPFTNDRGEGDGRPTTGAGTPFPGERNIDKTDVAESDQMGVTTVRLIPAFSLNFNQQGDGLLFNTYLKPGFVDTTVPRPSENDFVVSSGVFPLRAGQAESIALTFSIAATSTNPSPIQSNLENQRAVLRSIDNARQAYAVNYQFAQAPFTPILTAVPGDGRVTLYWDNGAEQSRDQFLESIGIDPFDFEGYRVYRSTDPGFLDRLVVTDGFGTRRFRLPIAQFDLANGISGFHPTDVDGVKFWLGDDSGIRNVFVDSTVTNGITYYYAVTSYDRGVPAANIAPTESPILIQRLADGAIVTGPNVARVVPSTPVSGYEQADITAINRVAGATTSRIGYQMINPTLFDSPRQYRVTFRDTLRLGNSAIADTLTTRDFSLIDVASGDTLIKNSRNLSSPETFPVYDRQGRPIGFSLRFFPDPFVSVNPDLTVWNSAQILPQTFGPYIAQGVRGARNPADYRIEIVADGQGDVSTQRVWRTRPGRPAESLPARPTNVRVFRINPDGTETKIKFAFAKLSGGATQLNTTTPVRFEADTGAGARETDLILFIEPLVGSTTGTEQVTWQLGLNTANQFIDQGRRNPVAGDVLRIVTRKPFLSPDVFEFTVNPSRFNTETGSSAMDNIRVVPNPYVAINEFEAPNPRSSGPGDRVIKFINLPQHAIVRIFSVDGRLIRTLRLNDGFTDPNDPSALLNGTLDWNLESEDGLAVSYGVYLYHVEAQGFPTKTGTFAIIK